MTIINLRDFYYWYTQDESRLRLYGAPAVLLRFGYGLAETAVRFFGQPGVSLLFATWSDLCHQYCDSDIDRAGRHGADSHTEL